MNTLIARVNTEITYRGYSARTGKSYCEHLLKLSRYFNKPLDAITDEELNQFFKDPAIRKLSRASQKVQINSIWFLFKNILHRPLTLDIVLPKAKLQAPHYLSGEDIRQLIDSCTDMRLKTSLFNLHQSSLISGFLLRLNR